MKGIKSMILPVAATCFIAASALMFSGCAGGGGDASLPEEQQLFIGDDIAIAQTEYGKVQGILLRGIYNFRGIPYGANTGGENRFMPPKAPEAWEDTFPDVW